MLACTHTKSAEQDIKKVWNTKFMTRNILHIEIFFKSNRKHYKKSGNWKFIFKNIPSTNPTILDNELHAPVKQNFLIKDTPHTLAQNSSSQK